MQVVIGFFIGDGVNILIKLNSRIFGRWLDNKISVAQSGWVFVSGQSGQFIIFIYTKSIY